MINTHFFKYSIFSAFLIVASIGAHADDRIPISTQTSITAPGSYVLTNNIVVTSGTGIYINASDVTLDLNVFTLSQTGGATFVDGIDIDPMQTNVEIRNGSIKGFSRHGIFLPGMVAASSDLKLKNLRVTGSGFTGIRLELHNGFVIEDCVVSKNKSGGIDARGAGLVLNNLVTDNLSYGLLVYSTTPVSYGGNVFYGNTNNVIGGTPLRLSTNTCGTTYCP